MKDTDLDCVPLGNFKFECCTHIVTYIWITFKRMTCFGTTLSKWWKLWPQWLLLEQGSSITLDDISLANI